MFDPNYGWSDAARRREAERLALHQPLIGLDYSQPLIGLDYSQPWMTWRGWLVCAVTMFALVWWVFV